MQVVARRAGAQPHGRWCDGLDMAAPAEALQGEGRRDRKEVVDEGEKLAYLLVPLGEDPRRWSTMCSCIGTFSVPRAHHASWSTATLWRWVERGG